MFEKLREHHIERKTARFHESITPEVKRLAYFFSGIGVAATSTNTIDGGAAHLPQALLAADSRLQVELEMEFNEIVRRYDLDENQIREAMAVASSPLYDPCYGNKS